MTEGIIARFRTMAIHRPSVIVGHVAGSVLQSIISVVLVGAVAVAIGFRVDRRHRPVVVSGVCRQQQRDADLNCYRSSPAPSSRSTRCRAGSA